jgi:Matrixin
MGFAPTRRSAKMWLVGLLVAMVMAMAMAEDASASFGEVVADSDGYVPVYSVCYSGTGYLAYYVWYYDDYGTVYGTVYVDDCLLADYGAGPYDRQMVIAHEMGHARGLPHSSDPNSYMYPYYAITGT